MTKKQTYIALGAALVVLLGVIGYLGMNTSNEPDLESGPPVLEENPNLSGTLTAEGDRYFRVNDDGLSGDELLNYSSKSPSNFLIFTTPSSFSNTTLDELAENLIVDDGLSGYVLGSYLPSRGGWNLYPEKNYLGARAMQATDQAEACRTYFIIKIADDHNNANGFGSANGWDAAERSKIAFDANYFNTVNAGTVGCTTEAKSLATNAWNMMTSDVAAADALLGELSLFEKTYAIWDTTVINQIDRSVDPAQTRNANVKLYVDSENTGVENNLSSYFAGNVKSASIFDANASYDGGKQDLWVYVGNLAEIVNEAPVLNPEDRTVDISAEVNQAKRESVEAGNLSAITALMLNKLKLPNEFVFSTYDQEGDALSLLTNASNGFTYQFDGSDIRTIDVDKNYIDLMLDDNGRRQYVLEASISDGNSDVSENATITYEWPNSCVDVAKQYENHLVKALEHRVYEVYKENGGEFDAALAQVIREVDETVANTNFGSTDPNLSEDQVRAEVLRYWESLKSSVAALTFDAAYLENPPYLPAQCGGGFSTCVEVATCTFMVESVSNYMYGFGILVEKLAYPVQAESSVTIEESVMTPESPVIEDFNRESFNTITAPESMEGNIESGSNLATLEQVCSEKQLSSSDVEWWDGQSAIPSQLSSAQSEGYKLYALVDLDPCGKTWELAYNDAAGNYTIGEMQVGVRYNVDPNMVYIIDRFDGSRSTSSYADVYMVLGGNGQVGVYISLVPMRSLYNDPVSGYDGAELNILDGVFWYNGNDLNGVSAQR